MSAQQSAFGRATRKDLPSAVTLIGENDTAALFGFPTAAAFNDYCQTHGDPVPRLRMEGDDQLYVNLATVQALLARRAPWTRMHVATGMHPYPLPDGSSLSPRARAAFRRRSKMLDAAIGIVFVRYSEGTAGVVRPTVAEYLCGHLWGVSIGGTDDNLHELVAQVEEELLWNAVL